MSQKDEPLRIRRAGALLVATILACAGLCTSSVRAQSSVEAHLVSLVNGERTSRGIAALLEKSDLASVARQHSQQMAASGHIYHNGSLASQVGGGWTLIAENVGSGSTVDAVHKAFMDSAPHRVHVLDARFNQIGVGIASSGGTLYVTEVFVRRSSGGHPAVHPLLPAHPHRARSRSAQKPAPTRAPERAVGVLLELVALDSQTLDPRSGLAIGV